MLVLNSAKNAIKNFQRKRILNGAAKCIQVVITKVMIFGGAAVPKARIESAASLVSTRAKMMRMMMMKRSVMMKFVITICGVCAAKMLVT